MANVIARIRLAPGEVGFYDEYTRIHLTYARPSEDVPAGKNISMIRRAVRSGRLIIVSGSLDEVAKPIVVEKAPEVPVAVVAVIVPEPVVEPVYIPVEEIAVEVEPEVETEEVIAEDEVIDNESDETETVTDPEATPEKKSVRNKKSRNR